MIETIGVFAQGMAMHANEREKLIQSLLAAKGFVSFRELEKRVDASPATI